MLILRLQQRGLWLEATLERRRLRAEGPLLYALIDFFVGLNVMDAT